MKEFRGAEALRYAREMSIDFDIDEDFLTEAEEALSGRRTSMADVDELIEEQTGSSYDPAEILPGTGVFDFLINRYGDGWIYIAVEGNDPEEEERRTLRLFRRLLEGPDPTSICDVKYLLKRFGRVRLGDTGFPREADLNLLFHAALRLVEKGLLASIPDSDSLAEGGTPSYGGRRFFVPANLEVSFLNVLCENCRRERDASSMRLHLECARRLKKGLAKAMRPE